MPFKIGQLDGSAPRQTEIRVIKRKASIELIAEQYQAFLESRDAEQEGEVQREEDPVVEEPTLKPTIFDPNQLRSASRQRAASCSAAAYLTPRPIESTIVDFEEVNSAEDVIYFKPVSYSSYDPIPSPQQSPSYDKPLPRTPPSDRPFQTCVSLLVDELTSVLATSPTGEYMDDSSSQEMQINTMIEVYERTREQAQSRGVGGSEQQHNVRDMFDCWLEALHAMRSSYADEFASGERRPPRRELKYRRVLGAQDMNMRAMQCRPVYW